MSSLNNYICIVSLCCTCCTLISKLNFCFYVRNRHVSLGLEAFDGCYCQFSRKVVVPVCQLHCQSSINYCHHKLVPEMAKVFQTFIRSKIFFVLYLMCTFWYFYWTHSFAVMALEYCHLSHRLSYCEIFFLSVDLDVIKGILLIMLIIKNDTVIY